MFLEWVDMQPGQNMVAGLVARVVILVDPVCGAGPEHVVLHIITDT